MARLRFRMKLLPKLLLIYWTVRSKHQWNLKWNMRFFFEKKHNWQCHLQNNLPIRVRYGESCVSSQYDILMALCKTSNSIANTLELPQHCTKPSICYYLCNCHLMSNIVSYFILTWYKRVYYGYGLSQWETTLHLMSSLTGWSHTENDPCITRFTILCWPFVWLTPLCWVEWRPVSQQDEPGSLQRSHPGCTNWNKQMWGILLSSSRASHSGGHNCE